MSTISYEQENHILDQMSDRLITHKIQTSDVNRIVKKPMNTPMAQPLKKSLDKSSRKAFGNVSNVLRSGTKHSIGAKSQMKKKITKDLEQSNMRSDSTKSMSTQTQTQTESKFFDEREDMHPIEEELMSDMRDSLTEDLFTIDEQIVLNMGFDSDMTECLLQNKPNFDFNDFL